MTCSADLQAAYTWLYSCMRNYIWDLDVVEVLADVEVDTFDAFVDYEKAKKDFGKLYPSVKDVADANEDSDLLEAADNFQKIIDDSVADESPAVFNLIQVQETVGNPEVKEKFLEDRLVDDFEEDESDLEEDESDLEEVPAEEADVEEYEEEA